MDSPNNVEENVMQEINSGRVKLRSKYIFLAEKLGLGSAFVLSVLLALLFFTLALFYLKASDNLVYLSLGSRGFFAFLESFPYLLVVAVIGLVFVAGYIIKRSDFSYKKPFVYFALGLPFLVLIGGSLLAFTNVAESIERRAFEGPNPEGRFFRPFLRSGFGERQRGVAGRIIQVSNEHIILQTPRNTILVDLKRLENIPDQDFSEGAFVVAVGERNKEVFEAYRIKIIDANEMPMIRHGVRRKFGSFEMTPPPPGSGE